MKDKIIQIIINHESEFNGETIYGLSVSGKLYQFDKEEHAWQKVTESPNYNV